MQGGPLNYTNGVCTCGRTCCRLVLVFRKRLCDEWRRKSFILKEFLKMMLFFSTLEMIITSKKDILKRHKSVESLGTHTTLIRFSEPITGEDVGVRCKGYTCSGF